MDVAAYLDRIGMSGLVELDLANLERLQRLHLTAVPFENLDVFYRRGVDTSHDWSVPKIVDRGRGGWCFELNGAFGALLSALGFEVRRMAATVLYPPVSPMPTHLTLEVSLDRPYLVDVSFGVDDKVESHYRFDRVPVVASDFDEASVSLQTDPELSWTQTPFATRLLDGGPDRVTLLRDRLKFKRQGQWTEESIKESEWPLLLDKWFGMVP